MKYFFYLSILILVTPLSLAIGAGVSPNELEFSENDPTQTLTIINPNDFPISYNLRNSHFHFEPDQGSIPPSSRQSVIATLIKNSNTTTNIILVETNPVNNSDLIGVLPTLGVKAKIKNPKPKPLNQEAQKVFHTPEIIIILVLAVAIIITLFYPNIKDRIKKSRPKKKKKQ
ncbi:hypothetical protein ACFL0V_04955 [Nanoarchaeota archaeon]